VPQYGENRETGKIPVRTHHCKDEFPLIHWHMLGRSVKNVESKSGDLPKKRSLSWVWERGGDDGKVPPQH